jgi:hypothetical protein
VTARDIPTPRPRLGSPSFPEGGDHWFRYGPRNYEPGFETVLPPDHYRQIAAEVLVLIKNQAEPFWRIHVTP